MHEERISISLKILSSKIFMRREFLNLDKNWFGWRENVFENIWSHWHAFHIIKFVLKLILQKIFQNFSSLDQSNLFLDQSKNSIFKAKSLNLFQFLLWFLLISRTYFKIFLILGSIPPNQSNLLVFVFKTLCLSWLILDWCSIDWN